MLSSLRSASTRASARPTMRRAPCLARLRPPKSASRSRANHRDYTSPVQQLRTGSVRGSVEEELIVARRPPPELDPPATAPVSLRSRSSSPVAACFSWRCPNQLASGCAIREAGIGGLRGDAVDSRPQRPLVPGAGLRRRRAQAGRSTAAPRRRAWRPSSRLSVRSRDTAAPSCRSGNRTAAARGAWPPTP